MLMNQFNNKITVFQTLLVLFFLISGISAHAHAESVDNVVDANNQFAADLYSHYKSKDGNIFFSPYSISAAFAVTYEGAKGKTADEIQSVFHFPKNDDVRRESFLKLYNHMNKKDKQYQLRTANALWAQQDYMFLDSYFGLIENVYQGKATNVDFIGATEKSRMTINSWVEGQTNDKIKDLIPTPPPEYINSDTRLVITNAIYFKGNWFKQFDKEMTEEREFRVTPEHAVKVEMMAMAGNKPTKFNYAETEEFQVLELPYAGEELTMIILLPKQTESLDNIEAELSVQQLSAWKSRLVQEDVVVYLPKFKFETKYFMKDDLMPMGMPTAFSNAADFSGMTGNKDLFIAHVIHQAFIEVNEEGTEAAASTVVIMAKSAGMPGENKTKIFNADHPFVFIIQEKETGAILFLGRVNNPNGS